MAQNTLASTLAHLKSSSPRAKTDSSPLSSINTSLLEKAGSQAFDATVGSEDVKDRKRKSEDSQVNEGEVEIKRARQNPTITHMIDEIEAYIDDHHAQTTMESSTMRETILTPSSPDAHHKVDSIAQATTLPLHTINPPSTPLPPTSPTPRSSTDSCSSPPSSPPTILLSPQHIFLARIPGSAPLKAHTIAKSAAWFAKLLTDGDRTDMIEIHKTLGLRLYQEEDLEAYHQLRSEAAAGAVRREALDLVNGLEDYDTEDEEHVSEAGTGWQTLRKKADQATAQALIQNRSRNVTAKQVSKKPAAKPKPKPIAATNPPPTYHPATDNQAYTLRLKHKGHNGFHGNAHYTAHGTPRTYNARRKLEEKDRVGAEDVVRVYE